MKNPAMTVATLDAILLAAGPAAACDHLRAERGWLRQPPPGSDSAAAYLVLHNDGSEALTVRGVSSPAFARAMMHETRYVEGRAEMRHLHAVEIAPGGRFEARPGGAHLMLVEPRQTLALDDMVELRFECAQGDPLVTWVPVRRSAPTP